jgi:hypothetical protein
MQLGGRRRSAHRRHGNGRLSRRASQFGPAGLATVLLPVGQVLLRPGCAHHRPLGWAPHRTTLARWATVRDAGDPRRPPRSSQTGQLGHLDFLRLLCQDEIARREAMSMTPTAPTPIRRPSYPRGLRLRRQPETAHRTHPRPRRPAVTPQWRVDLPHGPSVSARPTAPKPSATSPSAKAPKSVCNPPNWCPLFPNPVVAESLLDRLTYTRHQVFMNGPSYRPNKTARHRRAPGHHEDQVTSPTARPGGCVIAALGNSVIADKGRQPQPEPCCPDDQLGGELT